MKPGPARAAKIMVAVFDAEATPRRALEWLTDICLSEKWHTSHDDGIDFYGRLRLESLLLPEVRFPGLQKQLTIWIVGQAKHYQAIQVATPDIRDLVGAVVLARGNAYGSGTNKYSDLAIRPCDPVF